MLVRLLRAAARPTMALAFGARRRVERRSRSSSAADAAGGEHREAGALGPTRRTSSSVRAGERAVPVDRGAEHARRRPRRSGRSPRRASSPLSVQPRRAHDAVAHVERDHEPLAERRDHGVGSGPRGRADDDAVGAGVEQRLARPRASGSRPTPARGAGATAAATRRDELRPRPARRARRRGRRGGSASRPPPRSARASVDRARRRARRRRRSRPAARRTASVAEHVDGRDHLDRLSSHVYRHVNVLTWTYDDGRRGPDIHGRRKEMTELFEAIAVAGDAGRGGAASSGTSARCRSWRRWRTAGRWRGCWSRGCRTWRSRERTGASTTTVTRVAHWLRHGEGGYRLALDRLKRRRRDRLTIAVPAKGRLREPSVSLLEDAGLGPEQPGERALAFPCRNAPVDVLLVRAADVPEYVQDGVVDCGITGHRPRARARRARRRAAAARLRLVPARGGRARGVADHDARGSRRRVASRRSTRGSRASCCRSTSSSST